MANDHTRPHFGRRTIVALSTSGLLAVGAGSYLFATHASAAGPTGATLTGSASNVQTPAQAGPEGPDVQEQAGAAAESAGTTAEPTTAEADGPGGWADPAGSAGAADQQGEN